MCLYDRTLPEAGMKVPQVLHERVTALSPSPVAPRTHTKNIATCPAHPSRFILLWLWSSEAGRTDAIIPILCLKKLKLREASELPKVFYSSEDEVQKKTASVWTSRQPLSVTLSLAQLLGASGVMCGDQTLGV